MYTTPLSTLISSLSLNHHLYADDTQLCLLFHPRNFDSSFAHLQTALQQISSWMSASLLTLNSSKTKVLIIGLKQQLYKIDNCSLNTTHPARNLGFIFDEHLTFSDQISSLSKSPAILISESSAISVLTWFLKQPAPSLPLLCTLNLTTVTLSTAIFLSLK